ncbi:DUF805 domain-containing protein [Microbaculum marinisediminis]|uniref:DUF805 domain-containing protein n=1 Tax=Microbaculum marinisediminis TaxID=2931392 RepID=A0AAW5QSG1_9HYPH|nr:DUF805 domain-containing protein [Microbaculum sp. A6E488]MCT8970817.1 DUF805 domain-containing protein [Microbaculum sp. A6E488]
MANNPQIQGPRSAEQEAGREAFAWLFFGFNGRIGREAYWLAIGLLWSVLFVTISLLVSAVGQEAAAGPTLMLGLASLWLEMAILVKRQHDRGLPWFWCLLAFVPVVGMIWVVAAGVIPGDEGPNAFGDRADTPPA